MINRVFADRAYLDLCRTLRYKITIGDCEKSEFKNKSIDMIIEECENLYKKNVEEEYDDTHQKLCEKLFDIVNEADILDAGHIFSYGQAQKWVNMTMKYFVLMKNEVVNEGVKNFIKDYFCIYKECNMQFDANSSDDIFGTIVNAIELSDDLKKVFWNDNAIMNRFDSNIFE